ncbi:MAG: hypothetical protein KDA99_09455, partial [Planctomycetales bacterium]|nr:hypothetical protein [Planctomycetales bacterium]
MLIASDSGVAGDDLTINSGVTVQSIASNVTIHGGDNVALLGTAVIDAAGDVALVANAGAADALGAILADDGSVIKAGSDATVTMTAEGNVSLASVQASGNSLLRVFSNGGAILDGGDSDVDAAVGQVRLVASSGIGSGNSLELAADRLAAQNLTSGHINLTNSVGGLLTIDTVDSLSGITNTAVGGTVHVTNASPLTIAADVTVVGDITLIAGDSSAAGGVDNVMVSAGVNVQSTAGNVAYQAGDDVSLAATSITNAALGITITVDAPGSDPDAGPNDIGSIVTLSDAGNLVSTTGAVITGGDDADVFNIIPQINSTVSVNGGDPTSAPGDTLNLDASSLTALLTLVPNVAGFAGTLSASGVASVTATNIETWSPTNATVDVLVDHSGDMGNDATADTTTVSRDATDLLVVVDDGTNSPSIQVTLAGVRSLEVHGSTDDDTLVVQETASGLIGFGGSAPGGHTNDAFTDSGWLPNTVSVHFEGDGVGGSNDELVLQMTTFHNVAYFSDTEAANSGVVVVEGAFALSFDGLEPLTIVGAGGGLLVDATSTPTTSTLTLSDAGTPTDGVNVITGDGGFEATTFSGFNGLTIRGGDGAEVITVASVDAADPDGAGAGAALAFLFVTGENTTATDSGADTINIQHLPATVSASIGGGGGSDVFNVGSAGNSLSTILGPLSIVGHAHDAGDTSLTIHGDTNSQPTGDMLNLLDQGDAGSYSYSLNAASFSRTGTSTFTFVVESVQLLTGAGAADVDIVSTLGSQNVTVTTQDAADDIDVTTTGADSNVVINTAGGVDDVAIATTGIDGGDSNSFGSFVQVNAGDDGDTLTLQGSGAGSRVEFNGESGTDTIAVWATATGSVTNVTGGANTDTVNLGQAGSLDGLLGSIYVEGNGHDTGTVSLTIKTDTNTLDTGDILNLNDQSDADGNTYSLDATTFSRSGTGTVTYGSIESLNLNTSLGIADVNVDNTAAAVNTTINTQGAADDIDVTTTGADGNVVINTAGGVDDVAIATTGIDGGDSNSFGSFVQVNAGDDGDTLTLQGSGAGSRVELNGQSGTDTIAVWATATGSLTNVTGGANTDTVTIGQAGTLNNLLGDVCVEGDAHDAGTVGLTIKGATNTLDTGDILNLEDEADAGSHTYTLGATTFSRSGTGTVTYGSIETLNLDTSIGAADVDVVSTAAAVNTNISTQEAADDVDISSTGDDSNVTVDTAGGADDVTIVSTGVDAGDSNSLGSFLRVTAGNDADTLALQGNGVGSRVEQNGQSGTDTLTVASTASTSVTNLLGGTNTDQFLLGSTGSLGGLQGNTFVEGNGHDAGTTDLTIKGDTNSLPSGDVLTLFDQADAGSHTYTLNATTFTRTGTATVTYATIETLNLNTSTGAADVDVVNTAAQDNVTITTQDAADDIDVTTTGSDSTLVINTAGGADDVTIAMTGADGGDSNSLGSFVQVNAGGDADTLTLQGTAADSRVELNGQAGTDAIAIWTTAAGSVTNVSGGANTDTVNLGQAGSLGGLLGDICVEGDTHDAGTVGLTIKGVTNSLDSGDILNLNDQADAGSHTYMLDATAFSRSGTGTVTFGTVETLNLSTSIGTAEVDVLTT